MKGIYLTEEGKQEIETKIDELDNDKDAYDAIVKYKNKLKDEIQS